MLPRLPPYSLSYILKLLHFGLVFFVASPLIFFLVVCVLEKEARMAMTRVWYNVCKREGECHRREPKRSISDGGSRGALPLMMNEEAPPSPIECWVLDEQVRNIRKRKRPTERTRKRERKKKRGGSLTYQTHPHAASARICIGPRLI